MEEIIVVIEEAPVDEVVVLVEEAPSDEVIILVEEIAGPAGKDFRFEDFTTEQLELLKNSIPGLKTYSGLLTQEGLAAPVASLFTNNILAPDWERVDIGTFTLTKAGAFPSGKTIPVKEEDYIDSDGNLFKLIWTSADIMTLETYAAIDTDVLADGVLVNRYIYIEINA